MIRVLLWLLALTVLVGINLIVMNELLISFRTFVVSGNNSIETTGALFFVAMVTWLDVRVYKLVF